MAYIILGKTPHFLQKRLTTVGTDPGFDVVVTAKTKGLLFTLESTTSETKLLPTHKIRVNDRSTSSQVSLKSCDRVEWDGGAIVFVDSNTPAQTQSPPKANSLPPILGDLAAALDRGAPTESVIQTILDFFLQQSGAEIGYFLNARPPHGNWGIVQRASGSAENPSNDGSATAREVFSNTLVAEAVRKRDIVYVESVIGSQWGQVPSVVASRIFSAACLPLIAGENLLGAILLISRSPGRSIQRQSLSEISTIAALAAWMISARQALGLARAESHALRVHSGRSGPMILCAPTSPMKIALERVERLAPSPLSILVLGETGVGKELIAQSLHSQSDRASGPFVAVNCAAIPGTLLESILFGHERGAFTGAVKSQDGKFVLASGGTLFLDEVGDLPLELQAKLLRVLQEGVVDPVGSSRPVKVDVRLVAATHQDLTTLVRSGKFREDLFYRIAGATVTVPPLRDRPSDIPLLATHFLAAARSELKLTDDAVQKLKQHTWPGNVRELSQTMTRAAYCAPGMTVTPDLIEFISAGRSHDAATTSEFADAFAEGQGLFAAQNQFTRALVERTLKRTDGSRAEAARRLGISERSLYRILAESENSPRPDSPVGPT